MPLSALEVADENQGSGSWISAFADKASPSSLRGGGMCAAQLTMTRLYGDLAGRLEVYADTALLVGAGIALAYSFYGMLTGR